MSTEYPYDINGILDSNLIKNEARTFPSVGSRGFSMIAPFKAPFHMETLVVKTTSGTLLRRGIDYELGWYYEGLSNRANAPEIFMAIVLKNMSHIGANVVLDYGTVGAEFTMPKAEWQAFAAAAIVNPIETTWDVLKDRPGAYSTDPNLTPMDEAVGWEDFVADLSKLVDESTLTYTRIKTMIDMHVNNEVNAHDIDLDSLGIAHLVTLKKASLAVLEEGIDNIKYLGVAETRAFLDKYYLKKSGTTAISINGPRNVFRGDEVQWTITDYDSFSTYSADGEGITATVEQNVIYGSVADDAPVGVMQLNLTRNGAVRQVGLNVVSTVIQVPSIIGVLNGQSNVSPNLTFGVSAFQTQPINRDSFDHMEYQVSRTLTFSDLLYNESSTKITDITLDLPDTTQLYLRARHVGQSGNVSNWSSPVSFITGLSSVPGPNYQANIVSDTQASWDFENYFVPDTLGAYETDGIEYQFLAWDTPPEPGYWDRFGVQSIVRSYDQFTTVTPTDGGIILSRIWGDNRERGVNYYSRVRILGANGNSEWSNTVTLMGLEELPEIEATPVASTSIASPGVFNIDYSKNQASFAELLADTDVVSGHQVLHLFNVYRADGSYVREYRFNYYKSEIDSGATIQAFNVGTSDQTIERIVEKCTFYGNVIIDGQLQVATGPTYEREWTRDEFAPVQVGSWWDIVPDHDIDVSGDDLGLINASVIPAIQQALAFDHVSDVQVDLAVLLYDAEGGTIDQYIEPFAREFIESEEISVWEMVDPGGFAYIAARLRITNKYGEQETGYWNDYKLYVSDTGTVSVETPLPPIQTIPLLDAGFSADVNTNLVVNVNSIRDQVTEMMNRPEFDMVMLEFRTTIYDSNGSRKQGGITSFHEANTVLSTAGNYTITGMYDGGSADASVRLIGIQYWNRGGSDRNTVELFHGGKYADDKKVYHDAEPSYNVPGVFPTFVVGADENINVISDSILPDMRETDAMPGILGTYFWTEGTYYDDEGNITHQSRNGVPLSTFESNPDYSLWAYPGKSSQGAGATRLEIKAWIVGNYYYAGQERDAVGPTSTGHSWTA